MKKLKTFSKSTTTLDFQTVILVLSYLLYSVLPILYWAANIALIVKT